MEAGVQIMGIEKHENIDLYFATYNLHTHIWGASTAPAVYIKVSDFRTLNKKNKHLTIQCKFVISYGESNLGTTSSF